MREYIEQLRRAGDLLIVEREVDPRHELAAVTRAVQRQGEKAVLFRHVRRTAMPVISNLYGSRKRLCALIGADDGNFCRRWNGLLDSWQGGATSAPILEEGADERQTGRLSDLPLITYYERDGAPYFTSAIFLAKEPETGVHNLSFHRTMYVSDGEVRVRLGSTHDLTRYQAKAEARGEALEAALLIGPPPSVFLAAGASLPYETDELDVAAALAGGGLTLRRCASIDLAVPAATEIVVEGRFLPKIRRPEGPFGEFMGYYVPVGDNHVFEVRHVSWREGAVFHSILCSSPEDMRLLEFSVAARIYRHLLGHVPGVVDVACGATLMSTVIKLRPQYEGHARHAILAAFGSHLDYNKLCIAVDEDIDIHDMDDVLHAYLARGRADTRAFILSDIPGFYRDPHRDHWGRLGIDATKPFGREAEFERARIPGEMSLRLEDYLDRG